MQVLLQRQVHLEGGREGRKKVAQLQLVHQNRLEVSPLTSRHLRRARRENPRPPSPQVTIRALTSVGLFVSSAAILGCRSSQDIVRAESGDRPKKEPTIHTTSNPLLFLLEDFPSKDQTAVLSVWGGERKGKERLSVLCVDLPAVLPLAANIPDIRSPGVWPGHLLPGSLLKIYVDEQEGRRRIVCQRDGEEVNNILFNERGDVLSAWVVDRAGKRVELVVDWEERTVEIKTSEQKDGEWVKRSAKRVFDERPFDERSRFCLRKEVERLNRIVAEANRLLRAWARTPAGREHLQRNPLTSSGDSH